MLMINHTAHESDSSGVDGYEQQYAPVDAPPPDETTSGARFLVTTKSM